MTLPDAIPLGKPTRYADQYDPSLLVPIARAAKRADIDVLAGQPLPFFGIDFWNAYELSWLNMRGKPQIALGQFLVPADTPGIIESKSLKLYLNSFNGTRLSSPQALQALLHQDLSEAAGSAVQVRLQLPETFHALRGQELAGVSLDRLDIDADQYQPDPTLLCANHEETPIAETLVSNLLKSNCLVTGQPDWGSVQIQYVGAPINQEGLLKYLISFRQHDEFHEQCVERIFMDVLRRCRPIKLAVYARYTRRGGLDINPFRTNYNAPWPENLRTMRQ